MSSFDGYGQSRRSGEEVGAAVLIVLLVVGLIFGKPAWNTYQEWKQERAIAHQLDERLEIQHRLTRNDDRVAGNAPVVVSGDMFFTTPKTTPFERCSFRCAAARKDGDSYKVTLPIGFTYKPGEYQRNDPERFDTHRISELTYWSPKEHRLVTLKATDGSNIPFPEELSARTVREMKVGERGYVDGTITLETSPGAGIVYGFGTVVSEPGDLMFGTDEMSVPIIRTDEGFTVCVPRGGNLIYSPDQKPDGKDLFPARLDDDC